MVAAGGFTAAARRLEMSKSTVSHRVGALGERPGARLLQRSTRVVRPTDAGLHRHEAQEDSFYVLEGTLTVQSFRQALRTPSTTRRRIRRG